MGVYAKQLCFNPPSFRLGGNAGCASQMKRMNPGRSGPARADVAGVQNGYIRSVRNNCLDK